VVPLFVLDPRLWGPAGPARRTWLVRSLAALRESTGGALVVRHGDPAAEVAAVASAARADTVHVSADAGVYGRRRDAAVEAALALDGRTLQRTGSPYAVGPGLLLTADARPYQVFSAYARAWRAHGAAPPAALPPDLQWRRPVADPRIRDDIPDEPPLDSLELPEVGEKAALARWHDFLDGALRGYGSQRNRPDLDGTSALSAHLKYGELHPRTLLADLRGVAGDDAERFRTELCWREFYADVLWHAPHSAWADLRPTLSAMTYDTGADADARFEAWAQGRTGFPVVDAGMRQLRAIGWVHNRVRMIVASFLVKDLHLPWQRGARHFLHHLRDGDVASNSHGWQWVAGTGTDPAPYFRIFNPVKQGLEHDPDGAYVRRWVPELRSVSGSAAHEPWRLPGGLPAGYPARIVDHATERAEALRRYAEARAT